MNTEYHVMTRAAREIAALMELTSETTKSGLQDPDERARYVELLFENGVLPERAACGDLVQLLADHASGVPMVPSMAKWLAEAKACCSQWLKTQEVRDTAWDEQNQLNRLRETRRQLLQNIAEESRRAEELVQWAENVVSAYRQRIVGDHSKNSAVAAEFAKDRFGAAAGARMLKEEIIPLLNKELVETEKKIADYTKAIGAPE